VNDRDTSAFFAALLDVLRPLMPWVTTIVLSVLATAAQIAEQVRGGAAFVWRNAIADYVICLFVAVVTHMMCERAGMDGMTRSILVAVSAHMGTRALGQYERFSDRLLGGGASKR